MKKIKVYIVVENWYKELGITEEYLIKDKQLIYALIHTDIKGFSMEECEDLLFKVRNKWFLSRGLFVYVKANV